MRLFVVSVVLCALVGGAGCAGGKDRVEPRQALRDEAGRFVYPRPVEQVWPEVERFLAQRGFVGHKVEGKYALLTEYAERFHESRISAGFVRYFVDARALGPTRCEVRILRHAMFSGDDAPRHADGVEQRMLQGDADPGHHEDTPDWGALDPTARHFARDFTRDLQMEWELLQQLEP